YNARRYEEAIRQYQRTLELDPRNAAVHESLGDAYERGGRYREEVEQWSEAAALTGDAELSAILVATDSKLSFSSVVRAVAEKRLERLLCMKSRGDHVPGITLARAYLRMTDNPPAREGLKKSC